MRIRPKHPNHAKMALYGDTAALPFVSTTAKMKRAIYSCDIFVYRDGHWHGVHSQHTAAG